MNNDLTETPLSPTPSAASSVGSLGASALTISTSLFRPRVPTPAVETKTAESVDTVSDATSDTVSHGPSPSSSSSDEICSICQHRLRDGTLLTTTNCNHSFHADCMVPMMSGSTRVMCPICRTVLREGPSPEPSTPGSEFDPGPRLRFPTDEEFLETQQRRTAENADEMRRTRDILRSSSSGRRSEDVSLMDGDVLDDVYSQSSVDNIAQIDSLIRRLRRRAFMILDSIHITNREKSRATLPKTIRRLRREIQMYEKKLRDLITHQGLDDEYMELMVRRRIALRLTSHDAVPAPHDSTDTDSEDV